LESTHNSVVNMVRHHGTRAYRLGYVRVVDKDDDDKLETVSQDRVFRENKGTMDELKAFLTKVTVAASL